MIHAPNQLVGAPLGTNVTLECIVEASPQSINFWLDNKGKLSLSLTLRHIFAHNTETDTDIIPFFTLSWTFTRVYIAFLSRANEMHRYANFGRMPSIKLSRHHINWRASTEVEGWLGYRCQLRKGTRGDQLKRRFITRFSRFSAIIAFEAKESYVLRVSIGTHENIHF